MKNLYLLRGLPGSGKSTLAREIATSFVEADMFFLNHNGEYVFDGSKIKEAHAWCKSTVREWMEINDNTWGIEFANIAVSNTFTQEWEMEDYYKLAEEYGYKVFSMIVENRHGGVNIHECPEEKIEQMRNRFEIKL